MTRQERDHLRYMAHQSERQAKQRDYYRAHPDYYKRKAREWEQKQREIVYERTTEQNTPTGSDGPATASVRLPTG